MFYCFHTRTINIFVNSTAPMFNYQMINIVILSAVAFSFLHNKPWSLLFTFGIFGCLYTVFNNITSNTGLISISMSVSVCGVFSIICIFQLLKEFIGCFDKSKLWKSAAILTITLTIGFQLYSQLYVRFNRTY